MTTDAPWEAGSVMSAGQIDISKVFKVTFDINVGANEYGADGMGFVLHNDPLGAAAIGGTGGNKGMLGITNGVGIEFDTYYNADDPNDIPNDHTGWQTLVNGAALSTIGDIGNIEDGLWHRVQIVSDGTTISYTVDGVAMANLSVAAAEAAIGGSPRAFRLYRRDRRPQRA